MKTRKSVLCALGLAAAFSLGTAVTASAQARSTRRIPVRKDEPAPMMHTDTVRIYVRDTVMMAGRRDTMMMTRYDTVMRMQMIPLGTMRSFEFGIGGGIASPMNNWRNSTKDGPAASAHLGFFPGAGPFGIRFSGDAAFLHHRETDCRGCQNPRLYSGSADLVLRFPIDRQGKLNPILYFLGGGGIDKFTDFLAYQADGVVVTAGQNTALRPALVPPFTTGGTNVAITNANRGTKSLFYHYDVGGGVMLGRGATRLFVEAKYVTINTEKLAFAGATTNGTHTSHIVPMIVGLSFGH